MQNQFFEEGNAHDLHPCTLESDERATVPVGAIFVFEHDILVYVDKYSDHRSIMDPRSQNVAPFIAVACK